MREEVVIQTLEPDVPYPAGEPPLMPRKIAIFALTILGLHIVGAIVFGTSPAGSLLGNLLQVAASFAATYCCFAAARRSVRFGEAFWILVGVGISVCGIADLGWTYYEVVLHRAPPQLSFVRFMFDTEEAFFAMAILLDRDEQAKQLDLGLVLDAIQIALIFLFVYVGLYYVPSLTLDPRETGLREFVVTNGQTLAVLLLALFRAFLASPGRAKQLYSGLAAYLTVYAIGSIIANYAQLIHETPTGNLLDLAWTVPLLWGAVWAARWKEPLDRSAKGPRITRTKTLGETILTNTLFGAAPVLVFLLSAGLGPEWGPVRRTLLSVSVICYIARMAIVDYRQARTADVARKQAQALDSAVDGMAMVSAEGKYSYVNEGYAQLLGRTTRNEMIGQPWKTVSVSATPGGANESTIRDALRAEGKWYGTVEIPGKDRSLIPVELSITLLPEGGVVVVSRDLTDRRKSEQARTEAEIRYKMIVEQIAAISYVAEPGVTGRWYYVSPQIETILGYSTEEWLEQCTEWLKFVHPDDRAAVIEAEAIAARQNSFQAEYRMIRKDGRTVWISDTAVIIRGSEKHPVMEGLLVDISERKLMEMQSQQARRMESVGRLAGGIAHDFNNLLTIIKGYTELARNRAGSSEVRSDIDRIEDASERAASLVRQLLAFSRKQVLQPKNLDLNSVIRNLEQLLPRLLGEDIRLQTALAEDLATIKADPSQVEQVLMNLVVNARDAMPQGGTLIIETSNVELDHRYAGEHVTVKPGAYVMLAVSDSGIGMSQETISHIFEPFFTTKGGSRGTGLGLATTYGIVKQSGGYIWVYSEPGQGSTFKVYFPRLDEPADVPVAAEQRKGVQRGSETILLVEDEEAVRELAATILETYGYNVLQAKDPAHAQTLAEKAGVDIQLVLTDVVMPSMTGRELVRKLTAKRPQLRVLYMSGYTDNVIASGGVLERGLAFLQKPFTPADLANKVREVLDAAALASKPRR